MAVKFSAKEPDGRAAGAGRERSRGQGRCDEMVILAKAGSALKAANGAHGAELGELSGLLHAGLVKREPEDLSRKVVDEPEPHALKPPRHKVRHMSARRRRARTHLHIPTDTCDILTRPRTMRRAARPPALSPAVAPPPARCSALVS
ncbi:hypothetical protein EVAR_8368_1 [Eumeta japonica]|uniref:Uncharacterized protein n=1 Tax=Eumeta variegata TaxID=151549 RepID=A0A4C1VD22_EUMVA|nr:hypothetical protein EVAR_8368_1 [Eumeta japonica]